MGTTETPLTAGEREALKVALYGNRAKTLTLEGGPVCEAVERIVADRVAQERAAWVAKVEAQAKDWQRTSDEFAEGNGGWNKVMRYKDAAATLRALIPANAAADTEAGR